MSSIDAAANSEGAIDVKTDFYTREGLWNLVQTVDYAKSSNYTHFNSTTTTITTTATTTTAYTLNNNNNNNTGVGSSLMNSSNEPVKLECLTVNSFKCENCKNRIELTTTDNIVKNNNENLSCKYCNHTLNSNSINNSMEIILLNYSREIYCYYYGIKQVCDFVWPLVFNLQINLSRFFFFLQPSDSKNLLDKKTYKAISVTCHDVNIEAYNKNKNSLIVVAGFNKGEIHVYYAFKKDSSQCFNSAVRYFELDLIYNKILFYFLKRKQLIKQKQRV